jgi:hypothetical protein
MGDENLDMENIEKRIDRIEVTLDSIDVILSSMSEKLDFLLSMLENIE